MKVHLVSECRGGSTYGGGLEGEVLGGRPFVPFESAAAVCVYVVVHHVPIALRSSSPSKSRRSVALFSSPVRGEATDCLTMEWTFIVRCAFQCIEVGITSFCP